MTQWGNQEHQGEPGFQETMRPDSEALSLLEGSCFGTLEALAWFSRQVDSRDYEILLQISGSRPLASCTSGIPDGQSERPIRHGRYTLDDSPIQTCRRPREYRIHEVCALLTDALLCILRRDFKGLHASHLFGPRPCPSLHHVALGVFDRCETQRRRRHERDSVLSRVELQGARKLRFYTLFIIQCGWIRIQN
jgi:hypothetical protein